MEPSTKAFELIRLFEASNVCKLKAYLDTGGVPTIGWGTTLYPDGKKVKMGDTCTEAQADEYLVHDVKETVASLKKLINVNISQSIFDALVSFVYNIGAGQFASSTMLKLINQSNFKLAAQQFPRWKFDNGVEHRGLLRRRMAEQKLFNEGISEISQSLPVEPEPSQTVITELKQEPSKPAQPYQPFRKNKKR